MTPEQRAIDYFLSSPDPSRSLANFMIGAVAGSENDEVLAAMARRYVAAYQIVMEGK